MSPSPGLLGLPSAKGQRGLTQWLNYHLSWLGSPEGRILSKLTWPREVYCTDNFDMMFVQSEMGVEGPSLALTIFCHLPSYKMDICSVPERAKIMGLNYFETPEIKWIIFICSFMDL